MLLTAEKGLGAISLTVLLGSAALLLFFTRGPSDSLVSRDACLLTGSFSAKGLHPATAAEDPRDAGEAASCRIISSRPPRTIRGTAMTRLQGEIFTRRFRRWGC